MADQLRMAQMSINDNRGPPNMNGPGIGPNSRQPSAYIPPHLRGRSGPPGPNSGPPSVNGSQGSGGTPPGTNAGLAASAWGTGPVPPR